ncbi:MAG TPA: hypothetical protein VGP63_27335, partial [Planctomycetaceae bacterium]|nr:hypothetical protein [Planctomycetaceae bacterium]
NAALNGLAFKPIAIGSATVVLSYTDVGNGQQATATINITVLKSGFRPSGTATPIGGANLALSTPSAAGTTDNNTMPVDSEVQLKGFAAALAVLGG